MKTLLFTPEEVAALKAKYPRFNEPWEDKEDEDLKTRFDHATPIKDIAISMGRSENSIRMRLMQIGIVYPNLSRAGEPWTEDDTSRLQKQYGSGWKVSQCARWLGRTREEVRDKMGELGLTETPGEKHKEWKAALVRTVIELFRSGMTEEEITLRLI
ncbi:MAG: hypothetical protein IK143_03845 [Bacteroidales bacterium]|nr:hypothetical protein [Bacteroidales bacterium]